MFQKRSELEKEGEIYEVLRDGLKFSHAFLKKKNTNELKTIFEGLKNDIDSFELIPDGKKEALLKKIKTKCICESVRGGGNNLNYSDIHNILNNDKVCQNATMKEHLEVINHVEALNYIDSIFKFHSDINPIKLKSIHKNIFRSIDRKNAGIYRERPISNSYQKYGLEDPKNLQKSMQSYFDFYNANKDQGIHPMIFGSIIFEKLLLIHPFESGNSKVALLFMNFILMKSNYYMISINSEVETKVEYHDALENVNSGSKSDVLSKFLLIEGINSYLYYISMLINLTNNVCKSFENRINGTNLEQKIFKILR